MIKSLPIENILSKVSLSSKKSVQKNNSDFGDMLKKAAVTAKDDVEHENVPNNHHKFENKRKTHSKDNKSKTDNNDKVGCACCDSRGYANNVQGNAEERKAGNKTKKDMADKAGNSSKLPDMKNKHLESKNMELKKKISIKSFKKTDSLNLKNGSEKVKNSSLKITKKQVSLNEITVKEIKEESSDVKNLKEVKNSKNVSKKISQETHLKTIKNQHETEKLLVLSKNSDVNESKIKIEPQKKDEILNDKENIKISKKDKNLLVEHNLSTKQIGHSNQNSLQFRKIKQINDKANLEAGVKNNQKEPSKIEKANVKVVDIEEIKNKYAKKLNIEKVEVSNKDTYKKEEIVRDMKLDHEKIRVVDIKKKTKVAGQSSKQSVVETNKTKTNVVVIQEGDKAVKIKTIKNAKNDKTIKVIETTQTEKNKGLLENSDAVSKINVKKVNKIKISSNVKISVNDKNSVRVIQNNSKSSSFNLVESLKEFARSTDKKDDKNTIIKSDLSLSQPQQTINNQIYDTSQTNSINRPYPMDKVIENIDKMINLKPPFNNTITIKLNPPHIGALQLQVKMDRDRNISAVITADDKNVLKIVNSHIDGLKTYLNSQGIKVSHVDVHNGFHEQANFGGGQNQGMFGNSQQNNAGGNRFDNFGGVFSNDEAVNLKGGVNYKKGHSVKGLDITV